jgi:hypothetical protein
MNLKQLLSHLAANFLLPVSIRLPDGSMVPPHFHITEVGVVAKNSKDCGGENMSSAKAYMQIWVANDVEHRLLCKKFFDIIGKCVNQIIVDTMEVDFEYQNGTINTFKLDGLSVESDTIVLILGNYYTACMSPDKCGIEVLMASKYCSEGSGCC